MSVQKHGWDQNMMMSLFTKEASFDAGVTMNASNACLMKGYEVDVEWDDVLATDKDEVTGTEHGTDQSLVEKRVKLTYKEPKAKPNTIAGLAALVLGSITSTQDGATGFYGHKIVPVAVDTALPSIQVEHKKGDVQYAFTGIKGSSFKLSGEENGFLALESVLRGSGTRDTSATAFVSAISESWLPVNTASAWLESGSDIDISASLVQGSQDISSATPEAIKARIKSFELVFNNNLEDQTGFGGAGVLQDIDKGRRSIEFKATLRFDDATELNHYINQDALAIELDFKGASISTNLFHGVQIIIPRFKLKKPAFPIGGVGDSLTLELEGDVQDDGTNSPLIIETYNDKAAYLA